MKIIPLGSINQPKTKTQLIKWLKTFMDERGIKHPFHAEEKPYLICKVVIEQTSDISLVLQYLPIDNQE